MGRLVRDLSVDYGPGMVVFGPGRYNFGDNITSWKAAHSEAIDDTSIPKGIAVVVGRDGLNAAINEVRCRWGLPPLPQ